MLYVSHSVKRLAPVEIATGWPRSQDYYITIFSGVNRTLD